MKTISLLVVQALFIAVAAYAQDFTFHSNNPFGMQLAKGTAGVAATSFLFYDYDFDGDQDLFLTGLDHIDNVPQPDWENLHFFLKVQNNIGDKLNPVFAQPVDFASNFPFPVGFFSPTMGDLNSDGIADLIVSADIDAIGNQSILQINGTPGNGWNVTNLDTAGLYPFVAESFFMPKLVDLDLDGDLDLLMSGFDPAFGEEDGPDVPNYYYAKNVGTVNNPSFVGWYSNPYGLTPNPAAETLTSGDIDNDGDVDLVGTTLFITEDSMAYINVHLNSPVNNKPNFTATLESPFGLPVVSGEDQFLSPNLVDIDGDGDLDFFVLEIQSDTALIRYYENDLCEPEQSDMQASICEGEVFTLGGIEFTIPGVYPVLLEGSDGCDSTVVLTLQVIGPVTVSFEESICSGEVFVINGEIFSEPGDYVVLITAANGCDSIVNLSLDVDVVDNSVTVTENTLTANLSNAFYQWFNCDTGEDVPFASGQSFTPSVTGNYAVRITDLFGCTIQSGCTMVVITGIEDLLSDKISIYPNPANDRIFILNNTGFKIESIGLMNILGKKLNATFQFNGNSIAINSLAKGTYLVSVKIEGVEVVKKVVK
ncbi:MAG: T9SS type A sorting domain-containing protein, partial [Saprospiraceae bacterium]